MPLSIGNCLLFWFIVRHDKFGNLISMKPADLASGGTIAPVDFQAVKNKAQNAKPEESWSVTAGGNATWLSWHWSINNVPIYAAAINFLQESLFAGPAPLKVSVLFDSTTTLATSQLKRVSQEEIHHAWILATHRDVILSKEKNIDDSFICFSVTA